jgi:hypothetical protein
MLIADKGPCKFAVNKRQNTNYSLLPVTRCSPDARTFHNIYKLQKHVLLRHQSYLIVFTGAKIYDLADNAPLCYYYYNDNFFFIHLFIYFSFLGSN